MGIINKFSESIWEKEESIFEKFELSLRIPDEDLNDVDFVEFYTIVDFDKIPDTGGCYWIWTDEPVKHSFHRNPTPARIRGGEIIYNGIAKDNIRSRIMHHLLGEDNDGWSGVSIDILFQASPSSHRKKVFAKKGKVPYIDGEPIRNKELLQNLHLSSKEKQFIKDNEIATYYFRNGINIFEPKHTKYKFRAYYIAGLKTLYLEYIEKKWREKYGIPKLCSYSSGR